jgi:hypothetical protein
MVKNGYPYRLAQEIIKPTNKKPITSHIIGIIHVGVLTKLLLAVLSTIPVIRGISTTMITAKLARIRSKSITTKKTITSPTNTGEPKAP